MRKLPSKIYRKTQASSAPIAHHVKTAVVVVSAANAVAVDAAVASAVTAASKLKAVSTTTVQVMQPWVPPRPLQAATLTHRPTKHSTMAKALSSAKVMIWPKAATMVNAVRVKANSASAERMEVNSASAVHVTATAVTVVSAAHAVIATTIVMLPTLNLQKISL
jgi:hypothetical protein